MCVLMQSHSFKVQGQSGFSHSATSPALFFGYLPASLVQGPSPSHLFPSLGVLLFLFLFLVFSSPFMPSVYISGFRTAISPWIFLLFIIVPGFLSFSFSNFHLYHSFHPFSFHSFFLSLFFFCHPLLLSGLICPAPQLCPLVQIMH